MNNVAPELPLVAVFLDATNALDSVEWFYIFGIMRRMGFPPLFLSWIRLLYQNPSANVLINGHLSPAFPITRGTRQGCPLSPLLFALAIEPLAAKLRQHHQDKAVRCQLRQILISLYADDVMLYIRDLPPNFNPILQESLVFDRLSGIHINWGKSRIFPLDFPLEWSDSKLRYLGIRISRDKEELMRLNYSSAIDRITCCVTRWIALPISKAGHL